MKILLTGGGTGGHFYPLIAIAQKIIEFSEKEKIIDIKLYYMSDSPYDKRMLFENSITYVQIPSGKMRLYFSFRNFIDYFKTATGMFFGLISMFFIYPDVVVSKGGYAAFPAVFAARILRIPVILHESDSYPGRLNLWTAKFARRIAVSWPEAAEYFPKEKTAFTGQPIRKEILLTGSDNSHEYFNLSKDIPTILIIGGSSGAQIINDIIINSLPNLVEKYQIIHQTGVKNFEDVKGRSSFVLATSSYARRYVALPYMNNVITRMATGSADLVISRAGSAIFEIASWGLPSIIIPITQSNGDHQRKNAYSYARAGCCKVIEESNLTTHVFENDINDLFNNPSKLALMKQKAESFANRNAGEEIAKEIIQLAMIHEK